MTTAQEQELNVMAFLYNGCVELLDEAQRRMMLGQMVLKVNCRGAIARLTKFTGVTFRTIKRGFYEAKSAMESEELNSRPIRLPGGGRKSVESSNPEILKYVQDILDEATYGSPEDGRKWTSLSHQNIADELKSRHGICICANTAGRLIEKLGYSKQANKKMN